MTLPIHISSIQTTSYSVKTVAAIRRESAQARSGLVGNALTFSRFGGLWHQTRLQTLQSGNRVVSG